MTTPPIYLHFFWHQHQPWYLDPQSKISVMPWVRLHGIKDYYDMAWLCRQFPGWKQTINLVPSLLEQLQLYTSGQLTDAFLDLSRKPAVALTPEDKLEILKNFFAGFAPQMVHPYPRYDELFRKRGTSPEHTLSHFSTQDFLDLQVWHNLVWIDPLWREDSTLPLRDLCEKQRDFTEKDKETILRIQDDILKKIIPIHQQLHQEGSLELTCTPYYHPILPLLCDNAVAKISNPRDPVPDPPFAFPQDAEWHIEQGLAYFERTFGFRPQGMWPSEGSVSDAACALMAQAGLKYFATDEAILYRSTFFNPRYATISETLYQLHRLTTPQGEIDCVFRNHSLSDRIGFVYQSWNGKEAAADFISQVKGLVKNWNSPTPPLINVILDGENCWEFYPHDGRDFLKYLVEGILADSQITPTTVPEYRQMHPAKPTLQSIFPGSWINSNFRIWIGHQEDNAAWHFLRRAREIIIEREDTLDEASLEEVWRMLHIAEGSDWFWWYGDENASSYEDLFDALFRNHIAHIYTLLNLDIPEAIKRPIKQPKRIEKQGGIFFRKPELGVPAKRYHDWVGARRITAKTSGGAMHVAKDQESSLRYGRFENYLCFTITLPDVVPQPNDMTVTFHFSTPSPAKIEFHAQNGDLPLSVYKNRVEGIVQLDTLSIQPSQEIWFFLEIDLGDGDRTTIPDTSELYLQGYLPTNASVYWFL
ncbi:MAG: glycoside hydrolase family 57 protein [bacterium]|jgi:alpha-amylase/alpha-mannosidase (GH57 family)|nr:glycoside hydrolase family 57 protein [bacterium]